ncbi:hypothetical protein BDV38DRAFT_228368 [Aspergillus pseudotamarii]|uniref:Uncharacterized protein n=1 Tax=Aspergillus pseudotamarii TaxID=132259 RepID=A0A5N6SDA9_ASPPS|nr:uncharacterized protein BDV38DRAFT_228368 [Aspergillus pseudotamarii]KAE8131849.1 hypothetical protein BDV38DRAFT_228368 [Aspergillus pseudotamarii]
MEPRWKDCNPLAGKRIIAVFCVNVFLNMRGVALDFLFFPFPLGARGRKCCQSHCLDPGTRAHAAKFIRVNSQHASKSEHDGLQS